MPLYRRLEKNAQLMDFKLRGVRRGTVVWPMAKSHRLGRACGERLRHMLRAEDVKSEAKHQRSSRRGWGPAASEKRGRRVCVIEFFS